MQSYYTRQMCAHPSNINNMRVVVSVSICVSEVSALQDRICIPFFSLFQSLRNIFVAPVCIASIVVQTSARA